MSELSLGKSIKNLSNEITRFVSGSINLETENRYTTIQFRVIDFIGRSSTGRMICQRDLEREFNIRRSTASGILQVLEKNNLIFRNKSLKDGRIKEVLLTPTGQDIFETRKKQIDTIDQQLIIGISSEEIYQFRHVMAQIYTNIDTYDTNTKRSDLT